ncbi:hypothetical protein JCM17380_24940 [Desulfosporosinus burensis]
MNVDVNSVMDKLAEQIKQLSFQLAVKDVQIETLQKEIEVQKGQ